MNKTKIEWCDMTWNPVTGCLNDCGYCYARKIASRFGCKSSDVDNFDGLFNGFTTDKGELCFELDNPIKLNNRKQPYPFGFSPTLHRYRLDEPIKINKSKNIFVCSMSDLFGDWVKDEWIVEVFKSCELAPQHNYLFLTKFPERYETLLNKHIPRNWWFGDTSTDPSNHKSCMVHHSVNLFISIEPIMGSFKGKTFKNYGWVIIGAETGNRKDKVVPKREWIENIIEDCKKNNIPVFMKDSLKEIWGEELICEFPYGFNENRRCNNES